MTAGVTDPFLGTKEMAAWLGTTDEYVRLEIKDGKMEYENVSNSPRRKKYRVRLSVFRAYLERRGYRTLPTAADWNRPVTDRPDSTAVHA